MQITIEHNMWDPAWVHLSIRKNNSILIKILMQITSSRAICYGERRKGI